MFKNFIGKEGTRTDTKEMNILDLFNQFFLVQCLFEILNVGITSFVKGLYSTWVHAFK